MLTRYECRWPQLVLLCLHILLQSDLVYRSGHTFYHWLATGFKDGVVDHHSIGMILRIFPLAALFQERNAFVSLSFLLLFLFCTLIAELHLSSCLLSEGWLLVIGCFRLSLG
jgi:hypothetical protein